MLYLFWNEKQKPAPWLEDDFHKTKMRIGMDAVAGRGWPEEPGGGAGESIDLIFDVWKREVHDPGVVVLGPSLPRSAVYGIAVKSAEPAPQRIQDD